MALFLLLACIFDILNLFGKAADAESTRAAVGGHNSASLYPQDFLEAHFLSQSVHFIFYALV